MNEYPNVANESEAAIDALARELMKTAHMALPDVLASPLSVGGACAVSINQGQTLG